MSTSKSALRKKVETPRRTGVEFIAAVENSTQDQDVGDTFLYEDVSDISTVTPAARYPSKERARTAASRPPSNDGDRGGRGGRARGHAASNGNARRGALPVETDKV